MGSRELLTQLRRRIGDERYTVPAFTISALDRMATDVELEVRGGRLRTTIENGSGDARELNFDLTDVKYDTLGKLCDAITSTLSKQYNLTPTEGMLHGHPSIDLEELTVGDLHRDRVTLRTRRWSDEELIRFIVSGARRHNPSYTADTLPPAELDMVLTLAHVEVLRAAATDATKRVGLEGTPADYVNSAESLERGYNADSKRLAKALVPIRTDDDGVREGDVVVGAFARRSLRTGYQAPGYANLQPQAPLLYEVEESDAADFAVAVRWRRTRESYVWAVELWRDTQPDVRRSRNLDVYPSTSCRVWSSHARGQKDAEGFGTVDLAGELINTFLDGFVLPPVGQRITDQPNALEPDTIYWYRLYLCDVNGEYVASDPVQVRTKRTRAMFDRVLSDPMSARTGPRAGGTAVTITGSNFTENQPAVFFGAKQAGSVVVVNDTTITCTSPSTHAWTPAEVDVVLASRSGLRDVYPRGWRYT